DVNVRAAHLREELEAVTKVKTAVEADLAKERSLASEGKPSAAIVASLKELTAKHEGTVAELKDLKGKAADLAEMVQASEAAREAGVTELTKDKARLADLQKQVEANEKSLKTSETAKAELNQQKTALEKSLKTVAEEIKALKAEAAQQRA